MDRPLVLTRYPDGIKGKCFFQKDAPPSVPDWIRTERMWSEHAQREIHYFVSDDERVAALPGEPGHDPAARVVEPRVDAAARPTGASSISTPRTRRSRTSCASRTPCARSARRSGYRASSRPAARPGSTCCCRSAASCTYEQSRRLGELLARVIVGKLPEIATIARSPRSARRTRLRGLPAERARPLLVSPFCVRPLPGAPVSTPLRWSEVRAGLDIRAFTIRTVPKRMDALGEDPLAPLLAPENLDLTAVLAELAQRLDARPTKGSV